MRVLPRIHEDVNEEWLSDKSRHAFDGLKKQRLTKPMMRNKDNVYEECSWEEAFAAMSEKMLSLRGEEMAAIIGEFADVESITAIKDLFHRMDCENFEVRSNSSTLRFECSKTQSGFPGELPDELNHCRSGRCRFTLISGFQS